MSLCPKLPVKPLPRPVFYGREGDAVLGKVCPGPSQAPADPSPLSSL